MLFNQFEFFVLSAIVLLVIWRSQSNLLRKRFLLLVSYYFYAYWDYRFTSLLLISSVVDYWVGKAISRTEKQRSRKGLLLISLVVNLGMLGFFKYFNFFIDSAAPLLEQLGLHTQTLNIILPVGISFYTFQTLSYTLDVYRKQLKPCENFWDFSLFVSFFPQLVAGPVVRASQFLPQLDARPAFSWHEMFLGFRQFVFGLFKKVFIADRLAYFVDYAFGNSEAMSGATLWLAVTAYAIQIYCDFSGYSDMAIGLARTMGYRFEKNFNLPYIATNITDFWRRWHISLSTWLRDYLYIPLGGNQKGKTRTYINLMLTMVLGGLWHGASWSFVFWGLIHGLALAGHKVFRSYVIRPSDDESAVLRSVRRVICWVLTMLAVWVGWVYFRSNDFQVAHVILYKMFTLQPGLSFFPPLAIFVVVLMAIQHLGAVFGIEVELRADHPLTPVILFTMLGLVILFFPKGFQPFIYFQF